VDNSQQSECKTEDGLGLKNSKVYAQIKSYEVTTIHKKASHGKEKLQYQLRDNAKGERI
jgi:hypothetical protein